MRKIIFMGLIGIILLYLFGCSKSSTIKKLEKIANQIQFDGVLVNDLDLPPFYEGEVRAVWTSSHPDILSSDGKVHLPNKKMVITLWLTLSLESEEVMREFIFTTADVIDFNGHMLIDEAQDFNALMMNQVTLKDNVLVLEDDALEGFYLSNIFCTKPFRSLVGSWNGLSSKNATLELLVRVRINEIWSDYLSYGEWGLGRENKGKSSITSDELAEISIDEIKIRNQRVADAIQYKVVLRRDNLLIPSPTVSLIGLALEIPNYQPTINEDNLPLIVNYAVPKLNQNVVPKIGSSICSPTSVTMVLQYYGYDFSTIDVFPQRYIASLARDYGHKIYGNWSYNTAVIGAMGKKCYVKRMYSLSELKKHLAEIGPVIISVRGNMENLYTTNGHLMVVTGYKVTDQGTYFLCNDPNLSNVSYDYHENTFKNVWRQIAYVVM